MKQIIYILTSILIFTSCSQISSEKKQITQIKNEKLIGFKTMFLSELGDDKYDKLEQELKKEKIEVKYLNDIIYVSYLDELNGCGRYDGNIETIGDTIKLKVNLVSDEVCASILIKRITFLIDNPDEKKKLIKKIKNSH